MIFTRTARAVQDNAFSALHAVGHLPTVCEQMPAHLGLFWRVAHVIFEGAISEAVANFGKELTKLAFSLSRWTAGRVTRFSRGDHVRRELLGRTVQPELAAVVALRSRLCIAYPVQRVPPNS